MNEKQFIEKLFARAKATGLTEYEAYFKQGDSFRVTVFNGELDAYDVNTSVGLSFRAIHNGRMGYAYTEAFDDAAVEMLVERVIGNAGVKTEFAEHRLQVPQPVARRRPGDQDADRIARRPLDGGSCDRRLRDAHCNLDCAVRRMRNGRAQGGVGEKLGFRFGTFRLEEGGVLHDVRCHVAAGDQHVAAATGQAVEHPGEVVRHAHAAVRGGIGRHVARRMQGEQITA